MPYYGNYESHRVEFEGYVKHETDLAILFQYGEKEVWLPKSHIELENYLIESEKLLTIAIPLWLARQKGLEF